MDFDHLPQGAMLSVLFFSDYKSLLRMMVVSKTWHGLFLSNGGFWRRKLDTDFGGCEGGDADFEKEYKIDYGWRFKEPWVVKLQWNGHFIHSVKACAGFLVSLSLDSTVGLWDLQTMEYVQELKETKKVSLIALNNENLFIGFSSGEIRVRPLGSKAVCHSWKAHHDGLQAISICNGYLMSSHFPFFKIWDASTYECLCTSELNTTPTTCSEGTEIICGLGELNKVCVFHRENGFLYTLDIGNRVDSVCANSKHIFVGCGKGHVQVWDRETRENVATLDASSGLWGPVKHVWCDARKLISASVFASKNVYMNVWDPQSLTCIRTIKFGVERGILSMDRDNGKVVIGGFNGQIRVLDFEL